MIRSRIINAGLIGIAALALVTAARAQDEAPSLDEMRQAVAELPPGRIARPQSYEALTPGQKRYVEGVLTGPRNALSGPLVVMLASPDLGDLAQRAMAHARFAGTEGFGSVPPKLNELAVIMAAKSWASPYVWNAHHRYAVRVGLPPALVEAVRTGSAPPADLEPDVAAVYRFLTEFMANKEVSDATFAAARDALGGDRQVVDLIGTFAIYSMSAMLTAVDRTGLAPGESPALTPLD